MDNMRESFGYLWKPVAEACLKVFSSDLSPMLGRGRESPPSSNMQRSKMAAGAGNGNRELRQVRRQRKEKDTGTDSEMNQKRAGLRGKANRDGEQDCILPIA